MQNMINIISLAGLLHDIGKVVQRAGGKSGTHSKIGKEWLEKFKNINRLILDSVSYHHSDALKFAKLSSDHIAYLIYEADNIAAATDRRSSDIEVDGSKFNSTMPLESIFDYLKGVPDEDERTFHYLRGLIENNQYISFGKRKDTQEIAATQDKYKAIVDRMNQHIRNLDGSNESVTALINILEALWTYIPSSTSTEEIADISLFDHVKVTAGLANAMYLYTQEKGITNLKDYFYKEGQKQRDADTFRIVSGDLSGIQQFIYTVSGTGALKSLRGRSFYLDMLLEHIVDEILAKLHLNRCNLLYTGGGHFYLIVPNVSTIEDDLKKIQIQLNDWLMANTNVGVYIALGSIACSANHLMGKSQDKITIGDLFRKLAIILNRDKSSRYTKEQLAELFNPNSSINMIKDGSRECAMCKSS